VSAVNVSSTAGKVALVTGTAPLPNGACPPAGGLIDFVGYGTTTNCADGAPTPNLGASLAAIRSASGCNDTNANGADFTAGAPAPHNATTPANVCGCAIAAVHNEAGDALEADSCSVVSPSSISVQTGTSAPITYGRLYESGMTGLGSANPNVRAQLGYGLPTANPQYEAGWTWINATYDASCSGCGNQDEYGASFTAPAPGTYAYAYRVSLDQGQTWTVCDLAQADGGAGSSPGLTFDLQHLGTLVVTP